MSLHVIIGPPASGKSTWVAAHAKPGDIVVDFDRLASALTAPNADIHTHSDPVRSAAFAARKAAIAAALRHTTDTDVYIIHSAPSPKALDTYAKHGGHIVKIDPGREVVMDRCQRMRSRQAVVTARRWYAEHVDQQITTAQSSRAW